MGLEHNGVHITVGLLSAHGLLITSGLSLKFFFVFVFVF